MPHWFHWADGGGYNFVSGPLADITIVTAFLGSAWFWLRQHNCHVHRCWRLSWHPHPGHGHPVCKHHHPHSQSGPRRRLRRRPTRRRRNMTTTHPQFAEHGSFAHLKLGRLPSLNKPTQLRLAKYLNKRELPEPPATFDLTQDVSAWPMYDNDRLGDCTCAAAGHMVEAWSAAIGHEIVPLDSAVDLFYWETGDPPAKTGQAGGDTDTGRVETDVLDYWRKHPLGEHEIDVYTAVNVKDGSEVLAGTWIFGGLYLGVALPITAQTQTVWDVVDPSLKGDSAPGSWGGHAIDVVSYSSSSRGFTIEVVTWGSLMQMTEAFWNAYVEEAYAIISPDYLGAKGTPAAFNLAELKADLAAFAA